MENKELTYPELMQEASKAGSPKQLLDNAEKKGILKGVAVGVAISGLILAITSLLSE